MQDFMPAVLVVEDDVTLRTVAVAAITGMGIVAYEAENGDDAIKIVAAHPEILLVFTDILMPGPIDGLTLAKQLHDRNDRIEIIVTSGMEMESGPSLPGYGTFIPKPYLPSQIMAVVRAKLIASSF